MVNNISNFLIGSLNNTFGSTNTYTYGILTSANINIGLNENDLQYIWDIIVNFYDNTCKYKETIGYICYCRE